LIHGLLEVDVTHARALLRKHTARTGEMLSFTAFIVACLVHAVDQDQRAQAYRNWRNRMIVFDEVDVVTLIEGRIEIREYLNLTSTFDHDVVDGTPAARFAQRLKELLESGYALDPAALTSLPTT
jgi:pyruvate/2-oxoglutarate dehydrogenase complex dihydrolipoamide acyltransferase (E2) component